MDGPLVSVIIPYYNREATIGRALDSVFRQSYRCWEVIVVDDGSRQCLHPGIAAQLGDARVRVIRHPLNRGVSAARNTGIAHARGDYLAFLDSDDWWRPEKMARQVAEAQASPSPQAAVCLTRLRVVMGNGWMPVRPVRAPEGEFALPHYLYTLGGLAQTSSILVSAPLARRVLFDEQLRLYEDHLFLIRAQALGGRVTMLADDLTVWMNDTPHGRLSSAQDMHSIRRFIELAQGGVDAPALAAFEARAAARPLWRRAPLRLLALLAHAVRTGGLAPAQALFVLARAAMPAPLYDAVRKHLGAPWQRLGLGEGR